MRVYHWSEVIRHWIALYCIIISIRIIVSRSGSCIHISISLMMNRRLICEMSRRSYYLRCSQTDISILKVYFHFKIKHMFFWLNGYD